MYKLIASDMDETLLNDNHQICQHNIDMILKAKEKGVKFVPATGRGFMSIQHDLKTLGLYDELGEYVISFNGGALTENKDNQILFFEGLSFEKTKEIFEFGLDCHVCQHIYTKDTVYVFNLSESEAQRIQNQKVECVIMEENTIDFLIELDGIYDKIIDLNDEKAVEQAIEHIQIRLTPDNKVYLNDEDVSNQIRQDQVSLGASCVSKYQVVRSFLVDEQRKMAKAGNVILDGRDIGTVVLPNADLKIYQIASVETRAKRRYLENLERGLDADLETIKKEIEERDYQDTHREISPLKKAEDAIELDTSSLTLEEVVEQVLTLIQKAKEE